MTELMIFFVTVAVLAAIGLLVLEVYLDDGTDGRRHRPPQSHADDVFAAGAHHRTPDW